MKYRFVIILPLFNESSLIEKFIHQLEGSLSSINYNFTLLFVNDGSTDNSIDIISNYKIKSQNISIEIIELNSNSGHQNAIREGIIYTNFNLLEDTKGIIVMDSDGEDNPIAIKELTNLEDFDIVFVSRGKRKEKLTFKIGYFFYKQIFRLITGKSINFGNFSLLSPRVVKSISSKHFFHYSAFLSKQRFKIHTITYDRLKRINGSSKMGVKNLLFHGLKSFIEYTEEIVYFQLKLFGLLFLFLIGTSCYVFYSKYIAKDAVLGWTSSLLAELLNSLLIMFSSIIITTLILTIKNTLDQKTIVSKKYNN